LHPPRVLVDLVWLPAAVRSKPASIPVVSGQRADVAKAEHGRAVGLTIEARNNQNELPAIRGMAEAHSALVAATMLTLSDLVALHAFPGTAIPVGAVTVCLGGLYLVWLLARETSHR
jgi:ABC-type enterobactin transport system permease subunit